MNPSASTGATWQLQRPLVVWSDGMYWDGLVGIAQKKRPFIGICNKSPGKALESLIIFAQDCKLVKGETNISN